MNPTLKFGTRGQGVLFKWWSFPIQEPLGGAHADPALTSQTIKKTIVKYLKVSELHLIPFKISEISSMVCVKQCGLQERCVVPLSLIFDFAAGTP